MTTYVLVHGAWGGAHVWRKLRPLLWRAGHAAFTPALTGIGERSHLVSPLLNLSTHVRDVVQLATYEDLSEIVLVGFSYGGMVITGALPHLADRVRHLVYVDAVVPDDGQSFHDASRDAAPDEDAPADGGIPRDSGPGAAWLLPPLARTYDDPTEAAWEEARRTPQPLACFTEPVHLPRPLERWALTRTYVKATGEPRPAAGGPFWKAADRARDSPRWRYFEIETSHMVPSNRPDELCEILLDTAEP